jgi:hypothetical protein
MCVTVMLHAASNDRHDPQNSCSSCLFEQTGYSYLTAACPITVKSAQYSSARDSSCAAHKGHSSGSWYKPASCRVKGAECNRHAPTHLVLHSAAMIMACTTASGSSALACRMGAPMTLSTSEGWGLLRPWRGIVVKPTCAAAQHAGPTDLSTASCLYCTSTTSL